jgi:DNA-binding SARP family transcriptional activator/tetratricopeptide (TPR) repeat protein
VRVEIRLLGGFTVRVDGAVTAADEWRHRQAAALVKLLALTAGARLHRERVVDALWPDATLDAALPRLHKAAHYARRTLRSSQAVVLRDEVVSLFPAATLSVDVEAFDDASASALRPEHRSVEACGAALDLYGGELLPDDLGAPWTDEPRARLRLRFEQLLRVARRWDDLLALDPANEEAHVELLRAAADAGDRAGALRRYDLMARALEQELGIAPGPEAVALRERALSTKPPSPVSTAGSVRPATWPGVRDEDRLLERDGELRTLEALVTSALRDKRGAVVLLTGEAGSGKSALVRAFLGRLSDGIDVAVGGCDDLLAPRALGPFHDMAEARPELAAALSQGGDPYVLFPGLLRLIAARPTVVVVEDVHWADDATLDAIRYLSRRIPGVPAILVLTLREAHVDAAHPLRRVLGGLSSRTTRRLDLDPLSLVAVRRLAAASGSDGDEVYRVTRGNPFFVTEVLAAGGTGVPATVRDAVLARAGRLGPAAQSLVERLAVVPSRAERWLAETLAGGDPSVVTEAERAGIVSGGIDHVAFRHELSRQAVETALTGSERVQANRDVVDAMLAHGDVDPARLLHHAERAGRVDQLLRLGPVAAAEAVRAGAHRQAVEMLRVVLQHADRLDHSTTADLLSRRAYSLYVVNRYEEALDSATLAVSAAELSGDPIVLADALMVLSRAVLFARGPTRAREAAHRAVEVVEPTGDEARLAGALTELARAHSNLATVGVVAEPSEAAVACAGRAVELSTRLARDDLRAQALCYLGTGRLALGDRRGALDLEQAIGLTSTAARLEERVRSHVNAAGGAYRAGRFADAERYVAAGLRLAADGEFAAGQYRLRLTSAAVHASSGDWDLAAAELRELVRSPDEPGVMALLARSLLARLLARRGDPEAGEVLAAALTHPAASGDSFVAGPLAVAQAELSWLRGDVGDVPLLVRDALRLAELSGHRTVQSELAAYLRRGGHDAPAPDDPPGPWAPTLAGRWREAAAEWERLGERYEQAVELAWSGDDDRARASGLGILERCGAGATVALVESRRP